MAGSAERFRAAARRRGLDLEIRAYPDGTRTAEDAARAVGCEVGQIVKSLVFMADGEPLLALTSGANRADAGKLAALTGASEVRKANAEEAREATGYAIGGTPPFGLARGLPVLVDRDLLEHSVVWAAAGTPTSVFPLPPDVLLELSAGTPADLKEG